MGVWGRGRSRHVESALYPVPRVRGVGEEVPSFIETFLAPPFLRGHRGHQKSVTQSAKKEDRHTSCPDPVREDLSDHEQEMG